MSVPWPADRVERRALAALVPNARNVRLHSDAQVEQLMTSIREWGWTMPVLIDEDGHIIAGHGRVLAAERIGLAEVPVMVARGWTEQQKRAYLIADNKLTENATWDQALLKAEITDLMGSGTDPAVLGFTEQEVAALGAPPNDPVREWVGMPEFEQNSAKAHRTMIVHFVDAASVEDFAQRLGQDFTDKTKFLWHPPVENAAYRATHYRAAAE